MTPEDLSIPDVIATLRRAAARRRQAARWLMMAAIGLRCGRMGGWFGERQEHVRFLAFFDYTRDKGLMSEGFFTEHWPHHGMVLDPGWPEMLQWQN